MSVPDECIKLDVLTAGCRIHIRMMLSRSSTKPKPRSHWADAEVQRMHQVRFSTEPMFVLGCGIDVWELSACTSGWWSFGRSNWLL